MTTPQPTFVLSEDQKFQAALARFQDHAEILRAMTNIDLQILGGYITLQLGLAAWLGEHPLQNSFARGGLLLIDVTLAALAAKLLYNSYRRRLEVVSSLKNTLAFLRFQEKGAYLIESELDVPTIFRPWWYWYLIGVGVAVVGVSVVLFGGW